MALIVSIIFVALIFDFLNGLHDAANSIATIVSTRVLSPRYAVGWAAFFNFIAFTVFGLHVAATIGTGIISPTVIDDAVIFGALMGAIVWNVVTWLAGIPSSSSHALIGGLVGAGLCKGGWSVIVWQGLGKTAAAIFLSPATGFLRRDEDVHVGVLAVAHVVDEGYFLADVVLIAVVTVEEDADAPAWRRLRDLRRGLAGEQKNSEKDGHASGLSRRTATWRVRV